MWRVFFSPANAEQSSVGGGIASARRQSRRSQENEEVLLIAFDGFRRAVKIVERKPLIPVFQSGIIGIVRKRAADLGLS